MKTFVTILLILAVVLTIVNMCACEESQRVTIEFRNLGHEAFSADLKPCSGGYPEWHFQCDVLPLLDWDCWDLVIAFPPCTYLSWAGNRWQSEERFVKTLAAREFFYKCLHAHSHFVAVENPCGFINRELPPDQVICLNCVLLIWLIL